MNPIEASWRGPWDHRHPNCATVEDVKEDEQHMLEHDAHVHVKLKPTYPVSSLCSSPERLDQ